MLELKIQAETATDLRKALADLAAEFGVEKVCACAEKVLRTAMAWNADHRAKLDGLLFHGEVEKETYVLAYFASTRRLAICRA